MKVTNNYNLPEPLFQYLKGREYQFDINRLSVTTLIKPPRIVQLQRRHNDEIEEDCSDRIWMSVGTLLHGLFENVNVEDGIQEEKLTIEHESGITIVGKPDYILSPTLWDFKFTSIYTIMYGVSPEWREQLNFYAYLARENDIDVKELKICAIYRDWSKMKAQYDRSYPKHQVGIVGIPIWADVLCEEMIDKRVYSHISAHSLKDNSLPFCTEEERWADKDKFAVKKKNQKKAIRVLDSIDEAEEYIENMSNTKGVFIETRKGVYGKRCENYCNVKEFCNQYKEATNEAS